jgi:arabinose-5-phosphate isomerase
MRLVQSEVISNIKIKLMEESDAVSKTVQYVDSAFYEAVKAILRCKGKVVISGVGKSGHVGKKIAASLSCLGTPSFFMHADESLHGDIGMVDSKDIIILISNGGKTDEVLKMIPSLNLLGPKKIAITSSNDSPLAKLCDISLCVKVEKEIDHLNLAPTASALAVLAVGDALAVTVAELKNFDRKSFAIRHPMGSLGQQLLKEYQGAIVKEKKNETDSFVQQETINI